MALTVPRAGIQGGRAAQLANVPMPRDDSGAIFAQLGDRMAQVGAALEDDRLKHQLSQARVDMINGMNDLRLEFEEIGDPYRIDAEFGPRSQALKSQIMEGLDARNRPDADTIFGELEGSTAFALGSRSLGLRQSERMANLARTGDAVVRAGATADPDAQAVFLDQYGQQLDYLVSVGSITPEEREQKFRATASDMEAVGAIKMRTDNPGALIEKIDAGGYRWMDPKAIAKLRGQAASAKAASDNAALTEAERQRRERVSAGKDLLKDGIAVFGKGRTFSDQDQAAAILQDPDIAASDEARQYVYSKMLYEQMPGFSRMTLPRQREALAVAEARPIEKGFEGGLVDAMRSSIAEAEKGWDDDPLGYAAEIGIGSAAALPDPANATPEELVSALRGRSRAGGSLHDMGYVKAPRYFTPEERETWKAAVAKEQNPAQRARLASAFASGFGDGADDAAREIGADPLFTYVGGLVANGGNETLARQIFDGQRALDNQDVRMPATATRRSAFFTSFKGLFEDGTRDGRPDDNPQMQAIIAAADARYAYLRRGDPNALDTVLNEEIYKQAVFDVMGGRGTYGDGDATGGVQDVRGALTVMPPGVNGNTVERAYLQIRKGLGTPDAADVSWRDVSVNGRAPRAGGKPVDAATFNATKLRWVSGDQYELVVPDPRTGEMRGLKDEAGGPYLLSVGKLMKLGGGQ